MAKITATIYLASFLIINWADISWVFNYRAVTGLVNDFFNPYPSIDSGVMNAYFYPNHSQRAATVVATTLPTQAGEPVKEVKTVYTSKQNVLEISKISIEVPIIFSASADKNKITKELDSGVVYYPGSVYPGETGQIVILGHSAPVGWPHIKHDWVFSDLDDLVEGDKVFIHLNSKQYTYTVKKRVIIARGAEVPIDTSLAGNNVLTLISCWPPGKDYQRIAVIAVLET